MESPFVEKAIPMVSVDQNTGKYVVTQEAIKFLRAIPGPIAVVSVAGLYRTGKSYLLNRVLLNRSNGFGVGPTVNPCTKGLWCWGTPIKGTSTDGEPVNILVIDTEGIGALDEDTTHDTKIFTLAILASSCFIYNSQGSIDENAIQNLSLVVNLTKHIQLKAAGQDEDGDDPDEISVYFPSFYWVVRDFSLQLQDPQGNPITSKEYLEKALAPQNGFSDDIQEKNRIRRLLTAFFKDRDCYTMIRPLVDEQKLQNLDKMDYDELRPEFVHQAMSFRKRILSSVKVKSLQNQKLNGELYCSMINSYVGAINEGAVPNIENAWNYMCEEQCRKSLDDCYELFIKEMKEGFRDFPKPEEEFTKCVTEAEEKALEAFREKALGDRAPLVLKELKNRIRTQIAEVKDQNLKESHEQIRKYILKHVNPIKKKLTNQEYRSFQEFEKQLQALEEVMTKQGPKLHNYKLIYVEAMRKLSAQGAEFLFKNFTKVQEKDREMFKLKQKELQTQLESVTQQKDTLRKDHMQFTTSSDQTISEMNYKIETLTAQLNMTSQAKEEEEKKMERQFSTKYHELESNRKMMEVKIREQMEKIQENNKKYNLDKKEWQKQVALLDLKTKQQATQLEEISKKQKTDFASWNIEKNTMTSQVREITQRHEREKEEMKLKLKEFEDRTNELNEQLTSLKEELESKSEKLEKKDKKLKEEVANKNKEFERMKKQFEFEKKQMRQEFQGLKETSCRDSTMIEEKLKQSEKNFKELNDRFRKEKHNLESQNELIKQRYEFLNAENENLKAINQNMKEQFEIKIVTIEQTYTEKNEEIYSSQMTEINTKHQIQISNIRDTFENEKKRMTLELNNIIKKHQESEGQYLALKLQSSRKVLEFENIIEQLNDQIKHLKNSQRTLEGERTTEMEEKECRYKTQIQELESELEELKDKSHSEKMEQMRISEESISQIKNGYEMEKENLERRLRNEKDRYDRRINDLTTEHERKMQEETEPLLDEIQDLNEKLINLQEMLRNQSSHMQHEIDINMKRAQSFEKLNNEMKELHERKQKEFNIKYESLYSQTKADKEKLEIKIESLVNDHNKKDKDLMSITHSRDQLANNLEKKENKIKELETEMQSQKDSMTEQIQKLFAKLSEFEKEYHDKMTNYERENALLKQQDEFSRNKIAELEKTLENTNQIYEQKMANFKEEKIAEVKETISKLQIEKTEIEKKYRQYKNNSKDIEANMRKTIIDLQKEKEVLEVKVINLDEKFKDLEEKRTLEVMTLEADIAKFKEAYNKIKASYDIDCGNYKTQVDTLENQYNDLMLKFEKDKSLLEQNIAFLTNSKNENKKDYEERIKKMESQITQMQSLRNTEKTTIESRMSTFTIQTETKYKERISSLNEQIYKKTSEFEAVCKEKDHLIKELRQKYENEKLNRETSIVKLEKRLADASEVERRLKDEIERLKADRDRRESEYLKKEKDDKQAFKNKYNSIEMKYKEIEGDKMKYLFQFQKERSKWNYQKEAMNEYLSTMQEEMKNLEKVKDRYKIDVEKLKAERKNTKMHSYISGIKTTFEPTKVYVEETNKENSFSQQ